MPIICHALFPVDSSCPGHHIICCEHLVNVPYTSSGLVFVYPLPHPRLDSPPSSGDCEGS